MSTESYRQMKENAIELRKEGKTYSEIMAVIPVAKSTISLWLQDVGLAKKQVQRITEKRIEAQKKGAAARRTQRKNIQADIYEKCLSDITSLSKREIFLMGIVAYWAEGDKEKEWAPGRVMGFSNTDPRLIRLFLKWLTLIGDIKSERIHFSITLHETARHKVEEVKRFWSEETGFHLNQFERVYYKRSKIKTFRNNIGNLYNGVLRVKVRASSSLVRQMEGWARAINWGIV